jgi:replicative superfamily II helicase
LWKADGFREIVRNPQYPLWECKSEDDVTRAEINKREAEQMNRSSAWFDKHYPGMSVKRIIVHPANTVQSAAAFTHEVEAIARGRNQDVREFSEGVFQVLRVVEQRFIDCAQPRGARVAHLLLKEASQP